MFTGIVSDLGEVLDVEEKAEGLRRLNIACGYDPETIDIGASIACSGICLTVVGRGRTGNRSSFAVDAAAEDRKSTRLNSSHVRISYAVFCLKNKINAAEPGAASHDRPQDLRPLSEATGN